MSRLRNAAVQSALTLFRLIRSWYGVDRIRISPSAGRLLRIRTGDRVLIRDTYYSVMSRTVTTGCESGRGGTRVTSRLAGLQGDGVLRVELVTSFQSVSWLQTADGTIDVFDDDVVIIAGGAMAGEAMAGGAMAGGTMAGGTMAGAMPRSETAFSETESD